MDNDSDSAWYSPINLTLRSILCSKLTYQQSQSLLGIYLRTLNHT